MKRLAIFLLVLSLPVVTWPHTPSFAANSSSGEISSSSGQQDKYDAAAKACSKAKTGQMIAGGLWAAEAALCGYNCYSFFSLKSELTALSSALGTLQSAATAAQTCAGLANAPASTILANILDIYAQMGLVVPAEAIAKTAIALPVSLANSGTASNFVYETILNYTNALSVQATSLTGACSAQSGLYAAGTVLTLGGTGAALAACTTCNTSVPSAMSAVTSAAQALMTHMESVRSLGLICGAASFAVAGADIGLAATLSKKMTDGFMGLAGAAPALITLLTANKLDTSTVSVASMGKSSCWTSGLSLLLAGVKFYGAHQSNKCEKENRQRADELQEAQNESPTFAGAAASAASGTPQVGGFSTQASQSNSLPSNTPSVADSIRQAKELDPMIARVEQNQPGAFATALQKSEELFGQSAADFVTPGKLDLSQLAGMISKPMPQAQGGVASLIQSLQNEIPKSFASGELASLQAAATLGSSVSTIPQSGRGGGGGGNAGEAHPDMNAWFDALGKNSENPSAEAQQESFQKNTPSSVLDGIETDRSVSLFQRISRRYQASSSRLAHLKYQSRENKALSR